MPKQRGSAAKAPDFETFVRDTLKSLSTQVGEVIKGQKSLDSKFDKLDTRVKNNTTSINTIETSLGFQDTRLDDIEKANKEALSVIDTHKSQISDMTENAKRMESQINSLERYTRSFNLRFLNIPETEGENSREVLGSLLNDSLNVSGDVIENAHRTGLKRDSGPRQLIARFHSRVERNHVIRSARNADPRPSFIVVDDLTPADLTAKRRVAPLMERLYKDGKRPRFHAGRLYVGNRVLNERAITEQLEQLNNIAPPDVSDDED